MRVIATLFCFLFIGQIKAQDSLFTIKAHLLVDENILILDIKNNTDSILVFNARKPHCRVKKSICFIDMGLTCLNGAPTFLEPSNLSITYFIRILPNQSKIYSFLLDNEDGDQSTVKEWRIDFQYFYLLTNKTLWDGEENWKFVERLCEGGIGIYRLEGALIQEEISEKLCFNKLVFSQHRITFHKLDNCENQNLRRFRTPPAPQ